MEVYIKKFKHIRYNFFKWRYETSLVNKTLLALTFACLTGVLAQVKLYLPWTPVPITGQTFAVLLSGIILGKWGGISQGMYAGIGTLGVPWFAGGKGGIGVITGATGGYIIGFIMAAFFLGYFMDRYIRARSFFSMLALMLFANFVLIHLPGLLQLNIWFSMKGSPLTLERLLMLGTIPFIIGDVTKILIAAAITNGISPKRAFNGEVDTDKIKNWRIP